MKFTLLLTAAGMASAGVINRAEQNQAKMQRLLEIKTSQWDVMRANGTFGGASLYSDVLSKKACTDGTADGTYQCNNVDLHGFLSHESLGSATNDGNDVWGWTSPEGREFALVGQGDGLSFAEIEADGSLTYIGRLPTQTVNSAWRGVKVIDGYAYVGSEAADHGLQVFDLRKLLDATKGTVFNIDTDLTAHFTGFGSSHNIVSNEATKTIYVVGTSRSSACKGGLFIVDASDPSNPTSPGCASADGYVHDAQCVIYTGPDTRYTGNEICIGYDEDTITIFDVTDRTNLKILSRTSYTGATYTHQGWFTSSDMTHLVLDDELDEQDGVEPAAAGYTTTYIFDVTSLTAPKNTGHYQSPVKSIDHNQYVVDGLSYQSNYNSGLRIVDVSSVTSDASGAGFEEVGFFDCHPEDDEVGGIVEFSGSWSVYPYFKSGYILLNSIERGVYSLKYTG